MDLLPMTDARFAWLLGEAPPWPDAPRIAEGGLIEPEVVQMLRGHARHVGDEAAWLMVTNGEAVGLISIKERDASGRWDIAYLVAPSQEGRGHATDAVATLMNVARAHGGSGLTAETLTGGGASSRVLERNGFTCTGQFDHPEDGIVDQWKVEWA